MIDGNKYIMKDCGIDSLRIRRKWCLAKSEHLKNWNMKVINFVHKYREKESGDDLKLILNLFLKL